eukprot:TRINITY_DN18249_c0_g1_i1.p1 TRINITY_DN18249_c0_g1~~TRINITY_DN18249_c0_g1_i1.p1  ORF type:complete len:453 (+),score=32.97 TRINITY_DN18249_c0_g1_i1:61-1419(+)
MEESGGEPLILQLPTEVLCYIFGKLETYKNPSLVNRLFRWLSFEQKTEISHSTTNISKAITMFPKLKSIALSSRYPISLETLPHNLQSITKLDCVIDEVPIATHVNTLLPFLSNLKTLRWISFNLNMEELPPQLESLVSSHQNMPPKNCLQNLTRLQSLDLQGIPMQSINVLQDTPQLTELSVEYLVVSDFTAWLKNLPSSLQTLKLNTPAGLEKSDSILHLPTQLTSLRVTHANKVNAESLATVVGSMTNLIELEVGRMPVNKQLIRNLPTQLQRLSLSRSWFVPDVNPITETICDMLPKTLKHLDLGNSRDWSPTEIIGKWPDTIESIVLDGVKIEDSILNCLPNKLKHLSMYYSSGLTDERVELLPKTLESLSIRGSYGVTEVGLAKLPGTLRTLNIMNCDYLDEKKVIPNLPTSLRSLCITRHAEKEDGKRPEIFASHLPHLISLSYF